MCAVPFAISAQIRKWQTLENSVCTTVCFIFGKTATETFRASTHQGNWKPLQNSNFQIFLPNQVEHVEQDCAAHNDKLQCHFTTHGRPSNSRRLVFIIDYSSSVVQISLAYVPLNLLCDVLFRFYTICLAHQLF